MSEKFDQWKEHLERTYGRDFFFSKEWLEKEWAKLNSAPVKRGPTPEKISEKITETPHSDSSLEGIRKDLGDCKRCKLCKTRTNIVFGEGAPKARIMFVGEGPGQTEDETGRPFVGRAGQLLEKIIEAMGFKREEVYIANVVKCRPPDNRRPEDEEIAACEPFLFRQIDLIKPEVVVALGATALECLLKNDEHKITKVRGTFLEYRGTKLMPTYHPAYLLRNPPAKKDVWEDMKKVLKELGLKAPKG